MSRDSMEGAGRKRKHIINNMIKSLLGRDTAFAGYVYIYRIVLVVDRENGMPGGLQAHHI